MQTGDTISAIAEKNWVSQNTVFWENNLKYIRPWQKLRNQALYGHNDKLYVGVGDQVTQGQVIASMGSTGRSTGPHVHFEVRKSGKRLNPLAYVKLK